ncbi:Spermidine hydroxycinnamoyl transferase [Trametes pubescens]|uniref:Spermidine hydroxycinnamoyl transferase n=1 Tax=Trametes pubescens TaxID=154538 RepID=A0A1M2V7W1_TRAPU|nr:Spermidine hydroxycinnamoyl transferase [Trametes pubescens]
MSSTTPSLELISRTRILPEDHTGSGTRTVPLSILDNTVVNYAMTSAAWYYDKPAEGSQAFSSELLSKSLQKTINAYPQWAGQLQWIPYDLSRGQRHGRVCILYGSPADPGVEFIVTRFPTTLASLIPDNDTRIKNGVWCADDFPAAQLLYPTELALYNTKEYAGRPSVSVQLTAFACGGFGVALRIVHPIADATAMHQFVKDWSAINSALLNNHPPPTPAPIFDPSLVDKAAAGDLTKPAIDPEILRTARTLPLVRYDWWKFAPGCPAPMLPSTAIPQELAGTDLGPSETPAPWDTWDIFAPVSHCLLYFTPVEVQRLWEDASAQLPAGAPRVSRLDALFAHLWRLVVRARGQVADSAPNNLVVTLGVRGRLSPPLPDAFLGSPITLAAASLPGAALAGPSSLGAGAAAIRAALTAFTPEKLAAFLHELAYAVNPQRVWRAFLGERHSVVTSWLGLDLYGIDFGGGAPPRYVEAVMPNMDGVFHIMDARATSGDGSVQAGNRRWFDGPVCVSLHFNAESMRKLLEDSELRKYNDVY